MEGAAGQILRIGEHPELSDSAAAWFHQKWGIPQSAYRESMEDCLRGQSAIPQWYVALDGAQIIAGAGVIKNDFHDRKDLTPNVCAVYVEKERRGKGLAGKLLRFICEDCRAQGVGTLYLLTDHIGFYERYGWTFFCMAMGDGEETPSRMYVHRA